MEVIDSYSSAGQVMSYYLQNFPSFSLGVIHATSVHISLVTTRHVAFPHYKGAEKCGLLQKHQPPVIIVIPIAMLNSSLLNGRLIITDISEPSLCHPLEPAILIASDPYLQLGDGREGGTMSYSLDCRAERGKQARDQGSQS